MDKIKLELNKLLSLSKCKKRKVAAVIVDTKGNIVGRGYNHNPLKDECEDENFNTYPEVVHAEVDAIRDMHEHDNQGVKLYVTYPPCDNCKEAISNARLSYEVVEDMFMKFDTNKLRYSLIPPKACEHLAKVLTYGAKKYKPDNWRKVDNISRYEDALFRHIQAWRKGEIYDSESGLHHLAHAMTNIVFLLELEQLPKN